MTAADGSLECALLVADLPLLCEHGALDWLLLLRDLTHWGRRDRLVQRERAADFFDPTPSPRST